RLSDCRSEDGHSGQRRLADPARMVRAAIRQPPFPVTSPGHHARRAARHPCDGRVLRSRPWHPVSGPLQELEETIMANSLSQIEHFVVLMLENRSFDHFFGFKPGVNGLDGSEFNLVDPSQPQSRSNPAVKVVKTAGFEIVAKHALGPLHNVLDVNLQL